MVPPATSILTSLFTGLIGEIIIHFVQRDDSQNQNNRNNGNRQSENENRSIHGMDLMN